MKAEKHKAFSDKRSQTHFCRICWCRTWSSPQNSPGVSDCSWRPAGGRTKSFRAELSAWRYRGRQSMRKSLAVRPACCTTFEQGGAKSGTSVPVINALNKPLSQSPIASGCPAQDMHCTGSFGSAIPPVTGEAFSPLSYCERHRTSTFDSPSLRKFCLCIVFGVS